MVTATHRRKVTSASVRAGKGGEKLTSVTAYDYPTARIADAGGVGLPPGAGRRAVVVLAHPDTPKVTLVDMLHHTKAVARAKPMALLVAYLPFLTYGVDVRETIR